MQAYWWVVALILIVGIFVLWKILHKPRPELERLTEEKKQYHFCGKLDAYFVLQPEDEEEIPPFSFSMNKVKDGRVSLGALFGTYPEQAKALQLEDIFLIADENRNINLIPQIKIRCHGGEMQLHVCRYSTVLVLEISSTLLHPMGDMIWRSTMLQYLNDIYNITAFIVPRSNCRHQLWTKIAHNFSINQSKRRM